MKQSLCFEDLVLSLCIGLLPIDILGEGCMVGHMVGLFDLFSSESPQGSGVVELVDEKLT
jgi:hypothetical protein